MHLVRKAKAKKLNDECIENKGDSKKMWKTINRATNKKPKRNVIPDFVEASAADGEVIKVRNKSDIANVMNRQFSQMGAKLAEKLDPATTSFSDYLQFPNPNTSSIQLQPAIDSEVLYLIDNLDNSKSVGIDEIPPKLLK